MKDLKEIIQLMQANCCGFTTTETSAAGSLLYIHYLINIVIN